MPPIPWPNRSRMPAIHLHAAHASVRGTKPGFSHSYSTHRSLTLLRPKKETTSNMNVTPPMACAYRRQHSTPSSHASSAAPSRPTMISGVVPRPSEWTPADEEMEVRMAMSECIQTKNDNAGARKGGTKLTSPQAPAAPPHALWQSLPSNPPPHPLSAPRPVSPAAPPPSAPARS